MPSDLLTINGTTIYCECTGDGEPIVFIHGFSLDRRMWDDQVEHFAKTHRVIRYDLRGFGRSSLPATTPYSHAEDLRALLDHYAIPKTHLVGLSLGGMIAIDFALAFGERLKTLTLVGAALNDFGWSTEWRDSLSAIYVRAREGDLPGAKELWLEHPLFAAANRLPNTARRLRQMVDDYAGWHLVNRDPGRMLEALPVGRLGVIKVPTLVIVGECDIADFLGISRLIFDSLTLESKTLAFVSKSGHMVNMEEPHAFNLLLSGIVDE